MLSLRLTPMLALLACAGCVSVSPLGLDWPDSTLLYQPSHPADDGWHPPGLDYEDVFFESDDGQRLHAWYCPVEGPSALVVFAHGNAGSLEDRWHVARQLNEVCNFTVLLFDYRGYGKSEGRPSEAGLVADTKAARDWLANREGVEPSDIVLYGRSLGGAAVVQVAADDGARALVLESTFTSLPDVANSLLPFTRLGPLMHNRFASFDRIAEYHGPTWIAHGDEDSLVPYDHGKRLYWQANEPKQFYPLTGQDHNWVANRMYLEQLARFIDHPQTQPGAEHWSKPEGG
ncbi:Alpha/beta hydrolase family protein [Posidoniimonas polymericola]|uniref:Alpha/beta hydrolase family protein n=1 Tax=Posidoniimonas polymericola TaxID=2528002 RepID=A0A5C5YR33_9BACT|nr:alpha/beta hydrolase [Posidoniimonas polymericola]TWT77335.1 Alpha/beta hydrolase family protein [Posidoniimonas polymericola]